MARVPADRSGPWGAHLAHDAQLPDDEVPDAGTGQPAWERRWAGMPRSRRRVLVALGVVVVLGSASVWFRDWSAERARWQAVDVTTTFGIASSSTSPLGGSVGYFVLIRNDGVLPISVTSVAAATGGLRVESLDDGDRRVAAGSEVVVPLSVRLTCDGFDATDEDLPAEVGIRRDDGGAIEHAVDLEPAAVVLDVAGTLCAVRPGLRNYELTGPIVRGEPGQDPAAD